MLTRYNASMQSVSTLNLGSCCGLEFLAAQTSQYIYVPHSVLCNTLDGQTIPVDSFSGSVFCPCVGRAVAAAGLPVSHGTVTISAAAQCTALSQWRAVNGSCQQTLGCPPGQHLAAQYGQGVNKPAVQCCVSVVAGVTGECFYLIETVCEGVQCLTMLAITQSALLTHSLLRAALPVLPRHGRQLHRLR